MIDERRIERIHAFRRLRRLLDGRQCTADFVRFHARHKLQLLSHSPARCAELGRMVANARASAAEQLAHDYSGTFRAAMTAIATRGRHVNVLQHAAGYFRRVLPVEARRDLAAAIADYQHGALPRVVPIQLIRHYATLYDVRYLADQFYFEPYPPASTLRNDE